MKEKDRERERRCRMWIGEMVSNKVSSEQNLSYLN